MRTASLQQIISGMKGHEGADLTFELPHDARMQAWHLVEKIVEIGYRAALSAIEQWQAQQRGTCPSH